jgi:hypothetical protein
LPADFFAETLGGELVTGGDCATDDFAVQAPWVYDGVGEEYDIDGSQVSQKLLYQDISATIGSTFKVVYTIKNYSGSGNLQVVIGASGVYGPEQSANGTYTEYHTNKGLTTFLYFSADADFIGSVDDISVKEVTNAWDGMPPHGTLVTWWRPGESSGGSGTQGIVNTNDGYYNLSYANRNGILYSHDGTSGAGIGGGFTIDTWYKIAIQWGYLSSNVATLRIGKATVGGAMSWGIAVNYDGAYSAGGNGLQLGQAAIFPQHIGEIMFFRRILSDGEVDGL